MPSGDSSAIIVARYLKANNYTASYEAFVAEAGLPQHAGNVSKGDLTLETLLDEKKTFDIAVRFEKLGVTGTSSGWTTSAPCAPCAIKTLPTTSNILSARVEELSDGHSSSTQVLLVSTADRLLHVLDARTNVIRTSFSALHDSPILSCIVFRKQHVLTSSMSGQLYVSDLNGQVMERRRDHMKYVVRTCVLDDGISDPVVATAAWDSKVVIYRPDVSSGFRLGVPQATITLPTKPEAMIFLRHPDNEQPILLLSRTDSSFIYYYTVGEDPRLLGKQNLAPHSNAWVAFTPSAFELCPTDPALIAVGTSSIPHMKLLIVKLLFPPWESEAVPAPPQSLRASLLDDGPATETQASQARVALAIADREAAAIQIHCTTMAPQTAYSTPAVAWRPDGSGVWVNGDDGAIRGIEAKSGKIVCTLLGHDAGSKVRCLCVGKLGEDGERELLVSGGFDQKLLVWNT